MLGKYVILGAVVLALPSFARSVGEWNASENPTESPLDFGNLVSLQIALREAREFQNERRLAAVPATGGASSVSGVPVTTAETSAAATTTTNESTPIDKGTGERTVPTGMSIGGGSSFPIDVDRLSDLVEPVRAVPGVAVRNPLDGYLAGTSLTANRAPAVLPQNDPGLGAFATPPTSTFGDRGEQTFATLGSPGSRGENRETENQIQDATDQEQERKDREAFEEAISDLAGRQKPYSFKDYVDYRDFLAEQGGPLGQLDLSASDFKQKAEEIFDGFEKRDVSGETAPRKAIFRDFVKAPEDAAQRLIAEPSARDRAKAEGKKPSH